MRAFINFDKLRSDNINTIKLTDFTHEAASQTKGELLKAKLQVELEKRNKICVDFEGITKYATPFFNSSFSALAMIYGIERIQKIQKNNISDYGKHVAFFSLGNAESLICEALENSK